MLPAAVHAGAFGVVREAVDRSTKEKFCCKSIPRSSVTPEMMLDIRVEAQVMVHLRGEPCVFPWPADSCVCYQGLDLFR